MGKPVSRENSFLKIYPLTTLRQNISRVLHTPEFEHVNSKFEEMKGLLDNLGDSLYDTWKEQVPKDIAANIKKPLLVRKEDRLIDTNFDSTVGNPTFCSIRESVINANDF